MKSDKSSRLLDLNRDLPTSTADVIALRQARKDERQNLEAYLEFLANVAASSAAALRARKGPAGTKPFEL